MGAAEVYRASGSGLTINTGNPKGNIGGATSISYKGNFYCGNNNWIDMQYTISISCIDGVVKATGLPAGNGTFSMAVFSLESD